MAKKERPAFELITKLEVRFKFNTRAKSPQEVANRVKMNKNLRKVTTEIKSKVQMAVIQEYNRTSAVPITITTVPKEIK